MTKKLSLLKNFSLYFLFLLLISFPLSVNASTTDIGYVSSSTSVIISNGRGGDVNLGNNITNSSSILSDISQIIFTTNYSFQNDIIYQYEIYTPDAKILNSVNSFSILGNNVVCRFIGMSDMSSGFPKIYFSCPSSTNYITIGLGSLNNSNITTGSNFRWSYTYLRTIDSTDEIDLGPVISNATNNTNNIINNNNQNTQDIINNQNTNNQNIINGQNQNTQDIINNNDTNTNKIIDENKKNFETCRDSYNLLNNTAITQTINGITFTKNEDGTITANGTASGTVFYNLVRNISITSSGLYYSALSSTITGVSSFVANINDNRYTEYGNGIFIPSDFVISEIYVRISSGITLNNYLISPMLSKEKVSYEPYGEKICTNKLDEQTNAINNVDNTLKDDSVDENGVADTFDSFNDYLDDNSTITQLITLPITLYTAILNNLNGTCQPFNLGQLYGEDLILPCINISQYLGSSLWSMIDIIISGFAIYAISKKMIKVFNNFSSLREGDVIDD